MFRDVYAGTNQVHLPKAEWQVTETLSIKCTHRLTDSHATIMLLETLYLLLTWNPQPTSLSISIKSNGSWCAQHYCHQHASFFFHSSSLALPFPSFYLSILKIPIYTSSTHLTHCPFTILSPFSLYTYCQPAPPLFHLFYLANFELWERSSFSVWCPATQWWHLLSNVSLMYYQSWCLCVMELGLGLYTYCQPAPLSLHLFYLANFELWKRLGIFIFCADGQVWTTQVVALTLWNSFRVWQTL